MTNTRTNTCQDWTLLGRRVGTATGWDDSDFLVFRLYDFEPAPAVPLPKGDITIDLTKGTASLYNNEGVIVEEVDLIDSLIAVKRTDS